MNEPRDRHAKLLADVFHDDWIHGPAGNLARVAAAHARRHRRRRQTLLTAGALAGATALIVITLAHQRPHRAAPDSPLRSAAYEVISDEEFVSLLRDRPLLVLRKENGAREFVLLEN